MLTDQYCGSVSHKCGYIQVRAIATYVCFLILKLYFGIKDILQKWVHIQKCRSLLSLYLKWAADWLQMTYLSPNEAELVAMAEYLYQNGVQTKPLDNDDVPPGKNLREPSASIWRMRHSIQSLLDMGLQYIILTMGSHGAVLCSANTKSFGPHTSRWNTHVNLHHHSRAPS